MTTIAWAALLLFLPLVLLLYVTESRHTRIRRLRRNGATWKAIAARYGVSPSTAKDAQASRHRNVDQPAEDRLATLHAS